MAGNADTKNPELKLSGGPDDEFEFKKKYYSDRAVEIYDTYYREMLNNSFVYFYEIVKADTVTSRIDENEVIQKIGAGAKWMLHCFKSGNIIRKEDYYKFPDLYTEFQSLKKKLPVEQRSLHKWAKSLPELSSFLEDLKEMKLVEPSKRSRINDIQIIHENDSFIMYRPNTYEATNRLGKLFSGHPTQWCTNNKETYKYYSDSGRDLYVIVPKEGRDQRYQICYQTSEFANAQDLMARSIGFWDGLTNTYLGDTKKTLKAILDLFECFIVGFKIEWLKLPFKNGTERTNLIVDSKFLVEVFIVLGRSLYDKTWALQVNNKSNIQLFNELKGLINATPPEDSDDNSAANESRIMGKYEMLSILDAIVNTAFQIVLDRYARFRKPDSPDLTLKDVEALKNVFSEGRFSLEKKDRSPEELEIVKNFAANYLFSQIEKDTGLITSRPRGSVTSGSEFTFDSVHDYCVAELFDQYYSGYFNKDVFVVSRIHCDSFTKRLTESNAKYLLNEMMKNKAIPSITIELKHLSTDEIKIDKSLSKEEFEMLSTLLDRYNSHTRTKIGLSAVWRRGTFLYFMKLYFMYSYLVRINQTKNTRLLLDKVIQILAAKNDIDFYVNVAFNKEHREKYIAFKKEEFIKRGYIDIVFVRNMYKEPEGRNIFRWSQFQYAHYSTGCVSLCTAKIMMPIFQMYRELIDAGYKFKLSNYSKTALSDIAFQRFEGYLLPVLPLASDFEKIATPELIQFLFRSLADVMFAKHNMHGRHKSFPFRKFYSKKSGIQYANVLKGVFGLKAYKDTELNRYAQIFAKAGLSGNRENLSIMLKTILTSVTELSKEMPMSQMVMMGESHIYSRLMLFDKFFGTILLSFPRQSPEAVNKSVVLVLQSAMEKFDDAPVRSFQNNTFSHMNIPEKLLQLETIKSGLAKLF